MPGEEVSRDWLIGEFVGRLSSVFEMMTGERAAIACQATGSPAGGVSGDGLIWQQPFSGMPGAIWLNASKEDYAAIGSHVLKAAGVNDADAETTKSTYLETLSQALSGVGQALSGKMEREVTPGGGQEQDMPPSGGPAAVARWWRAEITLPDRVAMVHVGIENAFLDRLSEREPPENRVPPVAVAPTTSRTFDILLDVELPVSVSFGRAQVQLKDLLKLTTGSIVELNRSIAEPVEVIVNNCVIARGEVVVVEGNFGVRIQQVISRQERFRTLQ